MTAKAFDQTQSALPSYIRYFIFLCLLLLVNKVSSTSVLSVGLDEMLNNCDFVFEGRVVSVETKMVNNGRSIHTYVVFDILDKIKGDYDSAQIKLRFVGGTANGLTLRVGDMRIPGAGETGIYFVESLTRAPVYPFYGLSQGHLLIIKDAAGIERVATERKQIVMGVEPAIKNRKQNLSTGAAAGLNVKKGKNNANGMSKSQFVQKLRDMLR